MSNDVKLPTHPDLRNMALGMLRMMEVIDGVMDRLRTEPTKGEHIGYVDLVEPDMVIPVSDINEYIVDTADIRKDGIVDLAAVYRGKTIHAVPSRLAEEYGPDVFTDRKRAEMYLIPGQEAAALKAEAAARDIEYLGRVVDETKLQGGVESGQEQDRDPRVTRLGDAPGKTDG